MKVNICCQFDSLSFEYLLLSDGNMHEFSDHDTKGNHTTQKIMYFSNFSTSKELQWFYYFKGKICRTVVHNTIAWLQSVAS